MEELFIEDAFGRLVPNPKYVNEEQKDKKEEKYTQLEMEL